MRHIILLLLTAGLLSSCGSGNAPPAATAMPPPSLELFKGKWLVVNYWAVWCKPCLEEIPELNTLQSRHPDTVVVAGINFDEPPAEELAEAVARFGIEYRIFTQDPADLFGYPRPQQLPTTIIFTPDGKLHATRLGPQTADGLEILMQPLQQD